MIRNNKTKLPFKRYNRLSKRRKIILQLDSLVRDDVSLSPILVSLHESKILPDSLYWKRSIDQSNRLFQTRFNTPAGLIGYFDTQNTKAAAAIQQTMVVPTPPPNPLLRPTNRLRELFPSFRFPIWLNEFDSVEEPQNLQGLLQLFEAGEGVYVNHIQKRVVWNQNRVL